MVPAEEQLDACPEERVSERLAELHALVPRARAVAQVRREGSPGVHVQALRGAVDRKMRSRG